MDPKIIVAIVIVALIIIGVVLMIWRKREGERLKQQFGPEYERQVREAGGSRAKAEAELVKREKRVEKLDIKPLPPERRDAFAADWQEVQAKFVDDPERSIALADALVAEVMKARGYPVDDFEQRAADISVEHPGVVANYRAAHDIAVRRSQGKADTEDLRSALIGYRSLFDELLHADAPELTH
jgi:FtsZ-interacting cell division protein ZipA